MHPTISGISISTEECYRIEQINSASSDSALDQQNDDTFSLEGKSTCYKVFFIGGAVLLSPFIGIYKAAPHVWAGIKTAADWTYTNLLTPVGQAISHVASVVAELFEEMRIASA